MPMMKIQIVHFVSVVHQVRDPWLAEQLSFCVLVALNRRDVERRKSDTKRAKRTIRKGLWGQRLQLRAKRWCASNISAIINTSIDQIRHYNIVTRASLSLNLTRISQLSFSLPSQPGPYLIPHSPRKAQSWRFRTLLYRGRACS